MGVSDDRDSEKSIRELIKTGMNVARVNMSHSKHFKEEGEYIHGKTYRHDFDFIARIRSAAEKEGKQVAILGDLMGQKIRIGEFEHDEVELKAGDKFVLHGKIDAKGDQSGIGINHFAPLAKAFKKGAMFLFSDGLIRMKSEKMEDDNQTIVLKVLDNGILRSRQGVVLRGMSPDLPAFTKKDREDLKFLLDVEVDFIAVSYVRSVDDIMKIRGLIEAMSDESKRPEIIAKIETEEAINDIHRIICECDGIMVARGDLGVRMDVEDVPILQKDIIHICNILGKPVITATQMLESMISRPYPTRAEVTDVANAIFDGTDAVMLSGETAYGNYPIETVEIMRKIAAKAESARLRGVKVEYAKREWRKRIEMGIENLKSKKVYPESKTRSIADAITIAAAEIAEDLKLKAILTPTTSGYTARLMARFRPGVPIIAAVACPRVARKLMLSHAVFPVMVDKAETVDIIFENAHKQALKNGYLKSGDLFLATSGYPPNTPGATNLLKIVSA
jgi:pyruvate kinase